MNLPYRFQLRDRAGKCVREAADPSVVLYKDKFWLFASKSSGYWHSSDMREWKFVETKVLPAEDYAPDVRVINGAIHFTASRQNENCPIYRSTNPGADKWEKVSEPFPYFDPCMFQDDDGRVYLYWGCSNDNPIRGVELDPKTMTPIGEEKVLFAGKPDEHGWERGEDDNLKDRAPYIEGAWMTKHNGIYYLQYAAPGTEWNIYGDGVYTARSPLGPYEYASHNPFSFKPGGFITGAGHGSTFLDKHGNLWHIASMRISMGHLMERRIGLFPAGFDKDGILFCNTLFADYPTRFPDKKWDPWKDPFAGWMLLTYGKGTTASSSRQGHGHASAVDENIRSWWAATTGNPGEWLCVDMGNVCTVHVVQVNFYEDGCTQFGREGAPLRHQYLLESSLDGKTWAVACDKRKNETDVPHDYVEFDSPVEARFLRITNHHMPAGGLFAISGLRAFGLGHGKRPAQARSVTAVVDPANRRVAQVSWAPAKDAIGYNVLWGIAPDKLYSSWMVYGRNDLTLPCLNTGQRYWVRVDAFNENGITAGDTSIPATL
jgi:hypothetical protein